MEIDSMKKTTYILPLLSILALALVASSCNKRESIEPSHLVYFGINAPYARVGDIPFSINQRTREITNAEPIPGNVDLTKATPWFSTNDGKGVVTVKGTVQESGKTKQNLSSPVVYEVSSGGNVIKYTVTLTKSDFAKTNVAVKLAGKSPELMNEITKEQEAWLSSGARYTEVEVKTTKGQNWRISVVEADLADAGLAIKPIVAGNLKAAPAEGETWPTAKVADMAQAAESAGTKVFAAIGGDYMVSGTNAPEGGLIIDGKLWKSDFAAASGRYFGLRKDGRMSTGDGTDFMGMIEKLDQAISSRQSLIEDGVPNAGFKNDGTRSAKVAIGTNSYDMKTLYLVGIDIVGGSEGCTYSELAEVMMDLGAGQAICLLGGDKTAFVVKDGSSFRRVTDAASDVPVVNSIALVAKK